VLDPARDWVHCDVMDNHFVPNLTFGPLVIAAVRKLTTGVRRRAPDDRRAERSCLSFREAGADRSPCTSKPPPMWVAPARGRARHRRARSGSRSSPAPPLMAADQWLSDLDLLLVMTVEPGFRRAGLHVRDARQDPRRPTGARHGEPRSSSRWTAASTRDGPESPRDAGADVFVAGHSVYGQRIHARAR
jgi:ribulose-phosphate 3-epimerase